MVKKTRRGVYINLADSDIVYTHNGKIFRYTDINKDYNIDGLLNGVYDKVYTNMMYK